nr:prolipoprotein diacylglyceryl transferase [Bacteroidota bacterium]
MYPRFSDLINDILGTGFELPVQTYGFFVAFAFVVGGIMVYFELKRKGRIGIIPSQTKTITKGKPPRPGDLAITGVLYFVIGFKVIGIALNYHAFSDNPQDFLLSAEGNFVGGIVFAVVSVYLIYRKGKKEQLEKPVKETITVFPQQLTAGIILIAAFSGILGAKLFDVVEHLDDFFSDPFGTLFSFSGLTFYGGLIVATFAVAIYGEKNKIKWPVMADTVAPGLMIAYAVGRIGCQLSGDGCWGVPNLEPKPEWLAYLPDWMWSFNYPHNVIKEGVHIAGCDGKYCFELGQPVFPTPFYETTICTF